MDEFLRYACGAGLVAWAACVMLTLALIRADLADMSDSDE